MKIKAETLKNLKKLYSDSNATGLLKAASDLQVKSPNSIIGRVYTARAMRLEKRFDTAGDILESIILPFPRLKKLYVEYLDCLRQAGRKTQWEIQAFRFLEFHQSPRICLQLGKFFYMRKEWKRALHCFKRLKNTNSKKLSSYDLEAIMGQLSFRLGDHAGALQYLENIHTDEAFHIKARIHHDQGGYRQALAELKGMKSLQTNAKALGLACSLCRLLNDQDGEQFFLEQLIKLPVTQSRRWQILERLELLAVNSEDNAYRLQVIQAKRKLQPTNLPLKMEAASVLWEMNSKRRAIQLYEEIQREEPFDKQTLHRLSQYYEEKGDFDRAYQLLKGGFIGGSNNFTMDLRYAQLALRQGRVPEARDVLQDLLKDGRSKARIYYLLSTAYELEGREDISRYYKGLYDQYVQKASA